MDNPVEVAFTREGEAIFTSTFIDFSQPGYRDGIGHAIYGGVFGKANDALEDGRVKRTGPDLMHPFVQFGAGAPSGLCRYDSMAFGADYLDNNFFASLFNLHKITRHILRPSGATYASTDSDFLVSDSQDFHPTDVLQDADGSLLVVDTGGWYKLCCPSSQLSKPDVLGAIYRVKRKDVPHLSGPELKTARLRLTQPPVMADNTLSTPLKRAVWKNDPVNASWFREIVALHGPRAFTNAESAHIVGIAAEGLGRLRDRSGATVLPYSWPMDLSLENSVCRALIEIGDYTNTFRILVGLWPELGKLHPEIQATMIDPLVGFYPKNPGAIFPGMQRIGLIALDQMDGHSLKPADTVLFLDAGIVPNAPDGIGGKFQLGFDLANAPRLRETAQWILGRHPEWGEELAGWFRHELGAPNPNSARRAQLHAQFSILTRGESGQQLLADAVTKPGFKADTRVAALNAMAEAKLKQTPPGWRDAVLQGLDATPSGTDVSLRSAAIRAARTVTGSDDVSATLNKIGEDIQLPVAVRLDALSALPAGSSLSTSGFDFVCGQLAPTNAPTVRASAVSVLARTRLSAAQLGALTDSLRTAGPLELTRLLSVFAAGGDDVLGQKLVAALKESKSTRSLNPGQIRPQLAKYPEATRKNAEEFLATLNVDAGKQAARLDSLLVELKSFPGDIRRGQAVFNSAKAACVACHKLGYLGGNVGPDLTSLGAARTERDLLESIVYPSASFVRSFEPMIVSTKSGEELSGVLKKDAADEIVLATGPGIEVRLARNDIVEMRPGTVSIMPQGWDEQLSRQELSDLITFLKNTKWGPQ